MSIIKLDTGAREILKYLNDNSYMTYSTLATAFKDKYSETLDKAELTLDYLASEKLLKVQRYEEQISLIQVLHLGRTYEERLADELTQRNLEKKDNRKWEIRILILSSLSAIVVSILTNYVIK